MNNLRHIVKNSLVVLLVITAFNVKAQVSNDSVVIDALRDEIDRNMNDLKYKDYDDINFVAYIYTSSKLLSFKGELGALSFSDSSFHSGWSYRQTVGKHEFNDENFSNYNSSAGFEMPNIMSSIDIIPLEDDYYGLRRAFWLKSDESYRIAGKSLKDKKELISSGKLSESDFKLPDFTSAPKVLIHQNREVSGYNTRELEGLVKDYSGVFRKYPWLSYSKSMINMVLNNFYLANSEGSEIILPMDIKILSVVMDIEKDDKYCCAEVSVVLDYNQDFPKPDEMESELDTIAGLLNKYFDAEELEESYTGPVLICGQIAAKNIISNLFYNNSSLIANRNDLISDSDGKVYFSDIQNKWQKNVGKKILPDGLTVTDYPSMEMYNGQKLMGHYVVDKEAVMPVDSLVLVKNGQVMNFISSRVPTSVTNGSSGHYRLGFDNSVITYRLAPSVLRITDSEAKSIDELKADLIKRAIDEDLDFAIIVRSLPSAKAVMPYAIYKVNLETGEETFVKKASFSGSIKSSVMKKMAFSNDESVYNILFSTSNNYYYNYSENFCNFYNSYSDNTSVVGIPVSYIGPSAFLVDGITISHKSENEVLHVEEDAITNPLKRK